MLQKLLNKKNELVKDEKGLTLVELLIVLVIVLVLIGIAVVSFNSMARVDGTELVAESKNVESAILQKALASDDRTIPGEFTERVGTVERDAVFGTSELSKTFDNPIDASKVIQKVAEDVGLKPEFLVALLKPVKKEVQSAVGGKAKVENYVVVMRKADIYKDDALTQYDGYSDELAGKVFSSKTIIDSDGAYYNGTHRVSSADADKITATTDIFTGDLTGNAK